MAPLLPYPRLTVFRLKPSLVVCSWRRRNWEDNVRQGKSLVAGIYPNPGLNLPNLYPSVT